MALNLTHIDEFIYSLFGNCFNSVPYLVLVGLRLADNKNIVHSCKKTCIKVVLDSVGLGKLIESLHISVGKGFVNLDNNSVVLKVVHLNVALNLAS